MRQVGAPVIGRPGQLVEHAGDRIGRDAWQRHAKAHAGHGAFAPRRLGFGTLGHQRIDLVDELAEFGVEAIARLNERDPYFRGDAAGIRRKDQDAVGHQHRLLDIMRDHQDRFGRHLAFRPKIEKVRAQGFRRQYVKRREGFVHQ